MAGVGSITVRGKPYAVELTHDMRFRAQVGDVQVEASSKDKLEQAVGRELSRQREDLEIGIVLDMGDAFRRATLRGRHSRTRAYLLTVDGKKLTEDYPHTLCEAAAITDVELHALNTLTRAARRWPGDVVADGRRQDRGRLRPAAGTLHLRGCCSGRETRRALT